MAKKSSVYFGEPLMALTENLSDSDSVSGRINRMAERYAVIIKKCALPLTQDERFILGNVLCGSFVEPLLIRHLADEVLDSELANEAAAATLVEKLQDASIAELIATVESIGF